MRGTVGSEHKTVQAFSLSARHITMGPADTDPMAARFGSGTKSADPIDSFQGARRLRKRARSQARLVYRTIRFVVRALRKQAVDLR